MTNVEQVERLSRRYARTVGMIDELRIKAKMMKTNLFNLGDDGLFERVSKMQQEIFTYSNNLEEIRAELEGILYAID